MTNEINPNRGGPIHSATDTQSLRFPVRGRSDTDSSGSYRDRLQAQIEHGKSWEAAHVPEVDLSRPIIWPGAFMWDEAMFREDRDKWMGKFEASLELSAHNGGEG